MSETYSNSCRFCLKTVDFFDRVEITDTIRGQFEEIINIKLRKFILYPEFCCSDCYEELQMCIEIKEKFYLSQTVLDNHFMPEECNNTEDVLDLMNIKKEDLGEYEIVEVPVITDEINYLEAKLEEEEEDNSISQNEINDAELNKSKECAGTIRVSCKECGLVYRQDSLKKHYERVHLKNRHYECDLCSRRFYNKTEITEHLRMHKKEKNEDCPECGLKFMNLGSLRSHIQFKHRAQNKYICSFCEKPFISEIILNGHIRAKHTLEIPYLCSFNGCEKAYFRKKELTTHEKTFHAPNKICSICSLAVRDLGQHMKLHELKYVCDQIERKNKCGKKFPTNYHLQEHIAVRHRGIRKFPCSSCECAFAKRAQLQNHVQVVHESKRIKCKICSTLLTRKNCYRKHIMNDHRELEDDFINLLLEKIKNTRETDLFNHQE